MIEELENYLSEEKLRRILELGPNPDQKELKKILRMRPRADKAILKDVKMRTFITDDSARDDLVSHVYDITTGIIRPGIDNLCALMTPSFGGQRCVAAS